MVARIRRVIARWMHRSRHRQAKKRIQLSGPSRRILILCHGNICRSPYLAAVLQRMLPDVEVISAGLIAPDRSVPAHAMTLAGLRGLDLALHRSRIVTREMIAASGLIIVMEPSQADYISREFALASDRIVIAGDLDPMTSDGRAIRDPYLQPIEIFEQSYRRLDRCAMVIAQVFSSVRSRDHTTSTVRHREES